MENREKEEHNKKFILQYAMIHHKGVTKEDIMRFTDNELYVTSVLAFRKAFPDYMIMIEDITVEGDFVILHGVLRGTHEDDFHGIPATYRKMELPMITKFHVVGDKIINAWPMIDTLLLMEQLGAINRPT